MARKEAVVDPFKDMKQIADKDCFIIAIRPDEFDDMKFETFSWHSLSAPSLVRGVMMALLSEKFNKSLVDLAKSSDIQDVSTAIAVAESDNVIPANLFGDKFNKRGAS